MLLTLTLLRFVRLAAKFVRFRSLRPPTRLTLPKDQLPSPACVPTVIAPPKARLPSPPCSPMGFPLPKDRWPGPAGVAMGFGCRKLRVLRTPGREPRPRLLAIGARAARPAGHGVAPVAVRLGEEPRAPARLS